MASLCFFLPVAGDPDPPPEAEQVIVLHGLARTKRSMKKLADFLAEEGFGVHNVGYPSREKTVGVLTRDVIPPAIAACRKAKAEKIHFVTHSLGGILVRYYLRHHALPELGRVVMLAPPNQGTEVVDRLRGNVFFQWLNGPVGQQLGTGVESLPNRLGPVHFEVGVLAGDRSVNFLLSRLIPGPDDGKVSVKRAAVKGQADFLVVHASHPFIMNDRKVLKETAFFLRHGRFQRKGAAKKD